MQDGDKTNSWTGVSEPIKCRAWNANLQVQFRAQPILIPLSLLQQGYYNQYDWMKSVTSE